MNALTKKKRALAGYVMLALASRYLKKRGKRRGHGPKIAFYVALGVVSAGLLAGLWYFWRQQSSAVMAEADEVTDAAQDALGDATGTGVDDLSAAAESVADDVAQALEPTPAT